MLFDYILKNYKKDEPIFLYELPGNSRDYVRQEMKKLVDEGKVERLFNGVYYLSYTTILGTKGKISVEKYVDKKFLNINGKAEGYITGLQLSNMLGLTTQNPSCIEVCSNEATTKQRKIRIDGRDIVVYKPIIKVTNDNKSALQFLDLMTNIDKYSELSGDSLRQKLQEIVKILDIDFEVVKKLIPFFPDRVYKNIYQGGLMRELV